MNGGTSCCGDGLHWSGVVREGLDTLPCGGDRCAHGQDAQFSGFCGVRRARAGAPCGRCGSGAYSVLLWRACRPGQEPEPGQQDAGGHGRIQPGLCSARNHGIWEMAERGVLPGADHVLDPGVDPVTCVDVGALAAASPSCPRAGSSSTGRTGSARQPGRWRRRATVFSRAARLVHLCVKRGTSSSVAARGHGHA